MAKSAKKIIKRSLISLLVFLLILLFGLAGLGGWLYYLYHHPERLKPKLENYISRTAGGTCNIQDLNYSLDPIFVQVTGLNIVKAKELELKVGNLNIKLRRVSGKRKKLIIKDVSLNNFTINCNKIPSIPKVYSKSKSHPSIFSRLIKKIKVYSFHNEPLLFQHNGSHSTVDPAT